MDLKGHTSSNEIHESTTDPEARRYRKGPGMDAMVRFLGHVLIENRSGLLVDACLTAADGYAERIAADERAARRLARRSHAQGGQGL